MRINNFGEQSGVFHLNIKLRSKGSAQILYDTDCVVSYSTRPLYKVLLEGASSYIHGTTRMELMNNIRNALVAHHMSVNKIWTSLPDDYYLDVLEVEPQKK